MNAEKEKLVAEALGTSEGKKAMWEAMKPGGDIFINEIFAKWDKARQIRYVRFLGGNI